MYEEFYGLKEKPFGLTPDPQFLFLSQSHREALENINYAIHQKEGFVVLTGDIGTGKTTICRALLNRMKPGTATALIFNPFLSPEELLKPILLDFGIEVHQTSQGGLLNQLNQFLLDQSRSGKNSILIIDEAQNLSLALLERIRLLSNLETEKEKLLQIFLFGQEELNAKLNLPQLRQLNQRISIRYRMKPLKREEVLPYINHRLAVAGSHGSLLFTKTAINKIFEFSQGTPRLINLLCDRALLGGYTRQSHLITRQIVVEAVKSLRNEEEPGRLQPSFLYRLKFSIVLSIIIILLLGGISLFFFHSKLSPPLDKTFPIQERPSPPPQPKLSETPIVPSASAPQEKNIPPSEGEAMTIYVESYTEREAAAKVAESLTEKLKLHSYLSQVEIPGKGVQYRVFTGRFKDKDEAEVMNQKIKEEFPNARVVSASFAFGKGK